MVLVVFVHVNAPGIMSNSNLAGIGLYDMLRRAISLTLAQTAVPMFFFISGYLFFNRLHDWNWSVYLGKLRKRCKTLLVPFVLWNTIAIVDLRQRGLRTSRPPRRLSEEEGGAERSYCPCLQPLWFLRDLMVVMVLSPLLWCLFRYLRVWGLLILLFCYVSAVPIGSSLSTTSLFFFGAGAYMNMNQVNLPQLAWRYRYLVWTVAIVLWIVTVMAVGYDAYGNPKFSLISPFFVLAGIMAMMALAAVAVKKGHRIPALLSNSTFFIFVAHALLLEVSYNIFKSLLGNGSVLMLILRYFLAAILPVVICVLLYWLLRKFTPRLCGILTGQR